VSLSSPVPLFFAETKEAVSRTRQTALKDMESWQTLKGTHKKIIKVAKTGLHCGTLFVDLFIDQMFGHYF
jgi:hypothetical protein